MFSNLFFMGGGLSTQTSPTDYNGVLPSLSIKQQCDHQLVFVLQDTSIPHQLLEFIYEFGSHDMMLIIHNL